MIWLIRRRGRGRGRRRRREVGGLAERVRGRVGRNWVGCTLAF